jgi:uroporphyrinogen decarboxylase
VRAALEPDRALIGFAGAPWTVLTYMLEGGSSDRSQARSLAYTEPDRIDALIDVLVQATAKYLVMQVEAGAQALQLFESWAEGLAEPLFERLVTAPHKKLIGLLRDAGVTAPVIGFPRGAGALVEDYAAAVPVQGVAVDTQIPLATGRRIQAQGLAIQGALDPLLLRAGGPALDRRVEQLLEVWGQGPYIFNLGHGILPDTPIDHVERVLARVTGAV